MCRTLTFNVVPQKRVVGETKKVFGRLKRVVGKNNVAVPYVGLGIIHTHNRAICMILAYFMYDFSYAVGSSSVFLSQNRLPNLERNILL